MRLVSLWLDRLWLKSVAFTSPSHNYLQQQSFKRLTLFQITITYSSSHSKVCCSHFSKSGLPTATVIQNSVAVTSPSHNYLQQQSFKRLAVTFPSHDYLVQQSFKRLAVTSPSHDYLQQQSFKRLAVTFPSHDYLQQQSFKSLLQSLLQKSWLPTATVIQKSAAVTSPSHNYLQQQDFKSVTVTSPSHDYLQQQSFKRLAVTFPSHD